MFDDAVRQNLLALARAYAKAAKVPLSTVSKRAYGNGYFFAELQAGSNPSIVKITHLLRWFWENSPRNMIWPTLPQVDMNPGPGK